VSERRKLWQKDGSISPSSVDSANMNEQERLAEFDSAEELDDTRSASARKVCAIPVFFNLFFETEPFAAIMIAHRTHEHSQKFVSGAP